MDLGLDIATLRRAIVELHTRATDEADTYEFVVATENVASDGGILRLSGGDLTRYRQNPVVQWRHGFGPAQPVIGTTTSIKHDRKAKELVMRMRFNEAGTSPLADEVRALVDQKIIRAASVGFQIKKFAELTDKQRQELGLPSWGWVAVEWEMTEWSLVPVGADPGALRRAMESGEFTRSLSIETPAQRIPAPQPQTPTTDVRAITDAMQSSANIMRELSAQIRTLNDSVVILTDALDVIGETEPRPTASSRGTPATDEPDATATLTKGLSRLLTQFSGGRA